MKMHKIRSKVLSLGLAAVLLLSSAGFACAETVSEDQSGTEYTNSASGENAVLVDNDDVTLDQITVSKTGDSDDSEADFDGTNAAVLADNGATLTLTDSDITSDATHGNGVFSHGSGTTVNVSDSTITTSGNCSGGIMTTAGGTTNATDLTVSTSGTSSAAIRSDRGGGTVNVSGGTYSTTGTGSPAVYSTADINVDNARLSTSGSEALIIEGGNSISLNNTTVNGDNSKLNGKSTTYKNIFIYQSMSGDATEGSADFTMNGGSVTGENGDMFYVTNTTTDINLKDVTLTNNDEDGMLLKAEAAAWGTSGSNGGNVTLNADNQKLSDDISIDQYSTLNFYLKNSSEYTGAINADNEGGQVYVDLSDGTTWTLTGDSYITSLTCGTGSIDLNGHTLYVNGKAYTEGTASTGSAVTAKVSAGTGTGTGTTGQPPEGSGQSTAPSDNGTQGSTAAFTDVNSDAWYNNAVSYVRNNGIMSGTSGTTFDPSSDLTRAQIAQVLYNIGGSGATATTSAFGDVSSDSWYAKAVSWASSEGLVKGYSDSEYAPDSAITRQDLIVLLYRYASYKGYDTTATSDLSSYTDIGKVSDYAETAMKWAVANGVISGSDNQLNPQSSATRAEIAQILTNFSEKYGVKGTATTAANAGGTSPAGTTPPAKPDGDTSGSSTGTGTSTTSSAAA